MKPHCTQRGAALIVALIMLIVLTVLVLSAVRDSNSNLHVAGNMQKQTEAAAAAQQAIEQILSNNFTVALTATTVNVDVNNDAVTDYVVSVAVPTCESSTPLNNTTPNLPPQCLSSGTMSNTSGIVSASGASTATVQAWCDAQLWELQATATSTDSSGTATTVHQGASLNVPVGTPCP